MAERVQTVRETTTSGDDVTQTRRVVKESPANEAQNTASRVIWFIAGVILILLGFRFLLALLGANTSNPFANFVFSASHPLVAPFFSLFSYNSHYGISHFEIYTLFAMLVYTVLAWILTSLVNLSRD